MKSDLKQYLGVEIGPAQIPGDGAEDTERKIEYRRGAEQRHVGLAKGARRLVPHHQHQKQPRQHQTVDIEIVQRLPAGIRRQHAGVPLGHRHGILLFVDHAITLSGRLPLRRARPSPARCSLPVQLASSIGAPTLVGP
jgi:hypothetical protein